jgi:signal transduction histidine kinase
VVERSLELVRNQLELGNIAAEAETRGGLPMVRVNANQIEQVLVNIYTNAVKAMPNGGTLRVSTDLAPGGGAIAVTVTDTGVGIPPDVLPRIFDPFFTTSDVGGGTGLGLSVSYGIVTRHGGTIDVTSTPGEGSSFVISLPVTSEETADEGAISSPGRR